MSSKSKHILFIIFDIYMVFFLRSFADLQLNLQSIMGVGKPLKDSNQASVTQSHSGTPPPKEQSEEKQLETQQLSVQRDNNVPSSPAKPNRFLVSPVSEVSRPENLPIQGNLLSLYDEGEMNTLFQIYLGESEQPKQGRFVVQKASGALPTSPEPPQSPSQPNTVGSTPSPQLSSNYTTASESGPVSTETHSNTLPEDPVADLSQQFAAQANVQQPTAIIANQQQPQPTEEYHSLSVQQQQPQSIGNQAVEVINLLKFATKLLVS